MCLSRLLAVAFITTLVTGCGVVEEDANITRIDLPLQEAGQSLSLQNGPAYQAAETQPEGSLPDAFEVTSFTVEDQHVNYTAGAGKSTIAADGVIDIFFIFDNVPAAGVQITIEGDQFAHVTPNEVDMGSYSQNILHECLTTLSGGAPPDSLQTDLADDAIEDAVNQSLQASSMTISVLACPANNINGTVEIDRITVNVSH